MSLLFARFDSIEVPCILPSFVQQWIQCLWADTDEHIRACRGLQCWRIWCVWCIPDGTSTMRWHVCTAC